MLRIPDSWTLEHVEEIDSTNEAVKRALSDESLGEVPNYHVLTAKLQTAGRGQQGKSWDSSPGNLMTTIALPVERPLESKAGEGLASNGQLAFLTCCAVGDALEILYDLNNIIGYKWPNDVFLYNRKVAGILIETLRAVDGKTYALMGIGVNLVGHPKLPKDAGYQATNMQAVTGEVQKPQELLTLILQRFSALLVHWQRDGFGAIQERWQARAIGIGQYAQIKSSHGEHSGFYKGIDESGCLVLSGQDGDVMVSSGALLLGDQEKD